MYCCRCVASVYDPGAAGPAAVGRRRLVVPVAVPPAGRAGALVRLLPLPPVHEPHARRGHVPPPAAARHAGHLGQPEYRSVLLLCISHTMPL